MTDTTAPEEPADLPELPRGVALAWGMAASPQRGPKREMSVERIVEAAIGIADREGLGAVSMAAVAKTLGFTPMSLYRYVTAKDDLLLLMQEEASGLPPLPDAGSAPAGWRAEGERLYRAHLEVYLRHPWLLSLPIDGTPATPSTAAWMDAYLAAFAETPLDQAERMAAMLAIMGQARWVGTVSAGYAEAARRSGSTVAEVGEREAALFSALVDGDAYPRTRAALDAGAMEGERDPMAFGIERLMDGIAAHIEARAADPDRARSEQSRIPVSPALAADSPALAADKKVRAADKSVREAEKAVREAEKNLRVAQRAARQARREAGERLSRSGAAGG